MQPAPHRGARAPAPTWRSRLLCLLQPEFYYYYRSEFGFCLALGAISFAMHWLRNIRYPVFHTVVSVFYITVSCFFYLLSLGTLSWSENMLVHLLGVVYLYSAIITGMHMLAYPGMGLLPNIDEGNVAAQLYISMRYFQSAGFAIAFAFVVWRTRRSSALDDPGVSKRVGDREDSRALPPIHGLTPQARIHQQALSPAIQLTPVVDGTSANHTPTQPPPITQPSSQPSATTTNGRVKLQIVAPIVPIEALSPATNPLLTPITPNTNSSTHTPQIPTLSELHSRPSFKRHTTDSPQLILKDGEAYWNYPRSRNANDNRDGVSATNSPNTDRIIQLKPEDEVRGILGADLWTYRFSHVIGTIYTVLHALFVFVWPIYPNCFLTPTGLTWFKKGSEFAIVVLHIISLVILVLYQHDIFPKSLNFNEKDMLDDEEHRDANHNVWMKKSVSSYSRGLQSIEAVAENGPSEDSDEQPKSSRWQTNTHIQPIPWMIGGLVLNIAAEICFTVYDSLVAEANLLGHLFEFCATSMLSRGMFEAVFKSPLVILFKSANLQHIKLKETLNELKLAHHQLKSRMKLAGTAQFQALMQHEIRTPMNGLLGLSELLLEEVRVVDPNVYQFHQQRQGAKVSNTLEPAVNGLILATNASHSRAKDIKVSMSQSNSPSSISRSIHGSSPSTSYATLAQGPDSYLTPDHRSMLTTIHHCAGQLLSVLNGVLDIASIDAHTLHLESIPVDLAKLASRVVSMNESSANAKQIKLTCSVTGERGSKLSGNESILLADPHRFNQIFTQLVTNGIKFGKEGGSVNLSMQLLETTSTSKLQRSKSRLHQEIAAAAVSSNHIRHHMRHIRFEVTDCCEGIREDRLSTMFEPFASSAGGNMQNLLMRPNLQGLGLGLTLCKHLIQQMHGSIGCVNNPHAPGCIFYADVFLPVPTTKDFESMAHVREYEPPMAIELPSPMRLKHFTALECNVDSHTPVFHSSRSTEESRVGAPADSSQRDTSKAWTIPIDISGPKGDGSLDSQPMLLSQLEQIHELKQNNPTPSIEFPIITIHSEPNSGSDSATSPNPVDNVIKPEESQGTARITVDTSVSLRFDDTSPPPGGGEPNSAVAAAPSPHLSLKKSSPSGSPYSPSRNGVQDSKPAGNTRQPSPLPHALPSVSPSANVHILVVDDSSVNRRVLCHMLKHVCMELGWQVSVHIAENGQEGLDRYKQSLIDERELFARATETLPNHVTCASASAPVNTKVESKKQPSVKQGLYDLVFMDLMMPVMDGITCTKMIRQLECEQANEWKAYQETQKETLDSPSNGGAQRLRAPVRLPIVALTAMVTVEGVEESVTSMSYSATSTVKSGSTTPFSSLPSLPVTLFDEKILKPINKQQLKNLLIAIKTNCE